MKDNKIVVMAATGKQGGAVLDHLTKRGFTNLHAMVRNPNSDAAQKIASDRTSLIAGDFDDTASLRAAMNGAYGVFCALPLDDDNPVREIQQGKAVADAAKAAGVQHFVYSSVGGADRSEGVAHFMGKYEIEQYLKEIGVPASIVRPVAFMENFNEFMHPRTTETGQLIRLALHPNTKMQFIAVTDIGRVVADMFARPDAFIGKALEIGGEEVTGPQMAEIFTRATGISTRFEEQPIGEVAAFSGDIAAMFSWFNDHGYKADIAGLRQAYPEMTRLENWIKQNYIA